MKPTYEQHKILMSIKGSDGAYMDNNHKNIDMYWDLVGSGYLQNLVLVGGHYDWRFILTPKAEKYLKKI